MHFTFHLVSIGGNLWVLIHFHYQNGYLLIQGDDETEDEALPLHWTSPYLFPCGYSAQYNVPIIHPEREQNLKLLTSTV